MTGDDGNLRDALENAADEPGTGGVYEQIARRRSRYRMRTRLTTVSLAVVVLLALGSATWVLARSFDFGSSGPIVTPPPTAPLPSFGPVGPTTTGHESPAPTTEPSPGGTTSATTEPTSTAAGCVKRGSLHGDFDGDQKPDIATLNECTGQAERWILDIDWNGPAGSWPLEECSDACLLLAAPDVDGNGTDELAVSTVAFTIQDVVIYVAPPRETGPAPILVAPPGDPAGGFVSGDVARFGFGGDAFTAYNVRCTGSGPDLRMVVTAAESLPHDSIDAVWHVHETVLRLVGSSPMKVPNPGDPEFEVVSGRDYTLPSTDPEQQRLFARTDHFCGAPTTLP